MKKTNLTTTSQSPNCPQARRIRRYLWCFAAAWTLLLLTSAVLTVSEHKESLASLARAEAKTVIGRDILYRNWSSSHGGVYAPISEKNPPNPYLTGLPERDISTPSGRRLTLINPAYMTRQVYELSREEGASTGSVHLTSQDPIRPGNAPDPWEKKALVAFERGELEVSEMVQVEGQQFMRLMQAFSTEESCLKCHASQGYKVGDIRGGLAISLPVQPLAAAASRHIANSLAAHLIVWLLGLGMAGLAARQLTSSSRAQQRAEEQLASSLSLLNATLESTADGILVTDVNGHISRWNQKFVELWSIPPELLNTQAKYPVTRLIAAQMTQPDEFLRKVLKLYNNPQQSSSDKLQLKDGRCFKRFSQPQKIGETVVGRVWSFADITEQNMTEAALEKSNRKLEILSLTDGLTGIANRRRFDETLIREYALHLRSGAYLSLILLDIDQFKAFNDCYGHVAGDECLRRIGRLMAETTARPSDLAARYGGEEFACILPGTDAAGALSIAEKIRRNVQNLSIPHAQSSVAEWVTASLGVFTVKLAPEISVTDIMTSVDELLYRAKANGRNRVEHASRYAGSRVGGVQACRNDERQV